MRSKVLSDPSDSTSLGGHGRQGRPVACGTSTLSFTPMRIDKFTLKAQEAIQEGQSLARRANHGNYEPEHLLRALIDQQDGVVIPMLQKIGVDLKLLGQ